MKNNLSHPLACQCRPQLGEDCGCAQGMSGLDTPLEKTIAIVGLVATILSIFVSLRVLSRK